MELKATKIDSVCGLFIILKKNDKSNDKRTTKICLLNPAVNETEINKIKPTKSNVYFFFIIEIEINKGIASSAP